MPAPGKIHFITNGIFSTSIAGGDIVLFNLAYAAARAGYEINFFGGHAFKQIVPVHRLPGTVTLTDEAPMPKARGGLSGQIALFRDFYGRYRRTLKLLNEVGPEDYVCAASDYWFDVIPVVRSATQRKLMVLNMESPNFAQIVVRSRADVESSRVASLHYWASQTWSLQKFAACRNRHMIYLHPLMEPRLDRLGIGPEDRTWIYGIDCAAVDAVSAQQRIYDIVWMGRIHRQKGVDDLLATLEYLNGRLENFRALIIGTINEPFRANIEKHGLRDCVDFSGFISDAQKKIQLLKSSRVFLMPSKHEGSPLVIGESIAARTPVVAYEIPNYRPLFHDFVRYAPPFDLSAFKKLAEAEVLNMRSSRNYLDQANVAEFTHQNSWEITQEKFVHALEKIRVSIGVHS